MTVLAARTADTVTFHAVELFKQASVLQRAGIDIISLGVGEPDFTAAPQVVQAMESAARSGKSGYSPPAGLPELREAIARFYFEQLGTNVDANRVIVTSGASGALLLAAMALINPGDEVLMPDPCYPPNRNFVGAAGGTTKLIPTTIANRFQLSDTDIEQHWGPATRGVLIASPSNPTGTSIPRDALTRLIKQVHARNGFVMMDEIYLSLSYDGTRQSALAIDDNLIILNSFSKYFNMTGWRLGWMIVPTHMVEPIEKMAASLAICAPTLAQHGAIACFKPEALALFEQRREAFRQRRDYLVPALKTLNIDVPVMPDGAFYVYGDISAHSSDSSAFSAALLEGARVAAVAGLDFGPAHAAHTMRFAYTTGLERLQEAIHRMKTFLG
ncbi:MAG: pyridoxal phosphate-dependent aminotransferase [Alcaligenaceae bacterium]